MDSIVFSLSETDSMKENIADVLGLEKGRAEFRHFPDGESYVRIRSDVKGKRVFLLGRFNQPDPKFLPLCFFAETAKDLGAAHVCLIAPYLPYMRQDKQFNPGEGITSAYFARLLSTCFDSLVTVDPHLHRYKSLGDIYSIPTVVLHAADNISSWVSVNVEKPLLVGPDSESKQWVEKVAEDAGADYVVLKKKRYGDKDVKIDIPDIRAFKDHDPVLIDDIISTGTTMAEATRHMLDLGMKAPVCLVIHALFAENAEKKLNVSGVKNIVSCNTVPHAGNEIDISDRIIEGCSRIME